jgi:hypothetical protein
MKPDEAGCSGDQNFQANFLRLKPKSIHTDGLEPDLPAILAAYLSINMLWDIRSS